MCFDLSLIHQPIQPPVSENSGFWISLRIRIPRCAPEFSQSPNPGYRWSDAVEVVRWSSVVTVKRKLKRIDSVLKTNDLLELIFHLRARDQDDADGVSSFLDEAKDAQNLPFLLEEVNKSMHSPSHHVQSHFQSYRQIRPSASIFHSELNGE